MYLLDIFKNYLLTQKDAPSKATVKNYLADLRKFISWAETQFGKSFSPSEITFRMINDFKQEQTTHGAASSADRYISTLRKFFHIMKLEGQISTDPFEVSKKEQPEVTDVWHINQFKNYLYVYNSSTLTIKNYIIDIKQFLSWAEQVTGFATQTDEAKKSIFEFIDNKLVEEYKNRLFEEKIFSATSINRKLSSLRKYLSWASEQGYLYQVQMTSANHQTFPIQNSDVQALLQADIELPKIKDNQTDGISAKEKPYSSIPPLRLFQKVTKGLSILLDIIVVFSLVKAIKQVGHHIWRIQGKPVFSKKIIGFGPGRKSFFTRVSNISKSVYDPYGIKLTNLPWYKRVWHHINHTRPLWYKTYQQYAVAKYFNFAVVLIFAVILGVGIYSVLFGKGKTAGFAAAPISPLRILSFQGRLTDNSDNPITSTRNLRFTIYNDPTASGAARLWEEVDNVSPDSDGIFSILLGSNGSGGNALQCNSGNPPLSPATGTCGIPQSLFSQNNTLYLAITVENTTELSPRQQLATVAFATNAETLQGLPPTTDSAWVSAASNANAVLAINSSGTIAINGTGNATTTLQASSTNIKLSGNTTILSTNTGSNGNIQIAPDGLGFIDLQKPLHNSTNQNNIPSAVGSVEVDSLFSVLATSSGQSAITVNQNGAGPIISASASGTAVFTVSNGGSVTAAQFIDKDNTNYFIDPANAGNALIINGNAGIGTTNPSSFKLQVAGSAGPDVTNTYDLGSASLQWRNIYGQQVYSNGQLITSLFQRNNGAVQPLNITDDLLLGSTATTSARFAVINIAGGTPIASVSAGTSGGAYIGADGTIAATAKQGITLGTNTTGNIAIGKDATDRSITIGNSTGVNSLTEKVGTGTYTLDGTTTSTYSIGASTTTGTITVGGTAQTGAVTIGQSTSTNTLGIGVGITGAGSTQTINIGNGAINATGTTSINIGNSINNSAISFLSGTGNITLGSNSGNGNVIVSPNAGGQAALMIKDNGAGDLFTASVGATTKFTVGNTGAITDANYTTAGGIFYGTSTGLISESLAGSGGQCLTSNGANAPTWGACGTGGTSGWTIANGSIYPINSTLDLFVGGIATSSAKFSVLNINSGTPTASVSATATGTGIAIGGDGTIQSLQNSALTLGGPTTGNIILKPLNGTGTVTLSGYATGIIHSTSGVLSSSAINLATGDVTGTLGVGNGGTGVNTAATGTLFYGTGGTSALTPLTIGANNTILTSNGSAPQWSISLTLAGNLNVNGNTTIGTSSANTVSINALLNQDLIPTAGGVINLGSSANPFNTVYANNVIVPIGSGTSGFWALSNNNLRPTNTSYDLLIGGNATGSATPWQIFSSTVGVNTTGTATSSGNLTFRGATTKINALNDASINFQTAVGGDTGLVSALYIAPSATNTTSGNIGINTTNPSSFRLQIAGNVGPDANNTYDLGSNPSTGGKAWRNIYGIGFIQNGNNVLDTTNISGTTNRISKFTGTNTLGNSIITELSSQIGINNTNPQFLLDVATIGNSNKTVNKGGKVGILNDLLVEAASPSALALFNNLDTSAGADIITASSGGTTRFVIKNNGALGINTTTFQNANTQLQLADSAATDQQAIAVFGDGGDANRYQFLADRGGGGALYMTSTAGAIRTSGSLSLQNGNTTNLYMNTIGNIGIGANTNLGNAQLIVNQTNNSGLGDIFTASTAGSTKFTIANDGSIKNSLIPNLIGATGIDTLYNLGSPTAEWDTLYVRQIVTPSTGGISGLWQLSSSGVLAPANLSNDLAIAGTATSSAVWQVFATGINAGTATSSGNLTFRGANTKLSALNGGTLNIGNSVGGDAGFNSSLFIGASKNATTPGFIGINNINPTQQLDIVGNATVSGSLTFYGAQQTIASRLNAGLVIGDGQTGNLIFNPSGSSVFGSNVSPLLSSAIDIEKNALGNAAFVVNQQNTIGDIITASSSATGANTTQFRVTAGGSVVARQFIDLDNTNYYVDPAAAGNALVINGNALIGTTSASTKLAVAGDAQIGLDAPSFISGYGLRKQILLQNSSGSTLTSYQQKIVIDTASLITAGKMQASCNDLRFTDTDGATNLNYWIESGCNTNATTVWVKIPTIPGGQNKTIYMYYSNAAAAAGTNVATTFIRQVSNVQGAWRVDEPSGTTAPDYSGNGNNAVDSGANLTVPGVTGKFFTARSFSNSAPSGMSAPSSTSLAITGSVSLGAWINTSTVSLGQQGIIEKYDGNTRNGYAMRLATSQVQCYTLSASTVYNANSAAAAISTNTWYYVNCVYDSAGQTLKVFINGVQSGSTATSVLAPAAGTTPLRIGGQGSDGAQNFQGTIDEPRLYNKVLLTAEITDLYGNGGNNYGYVTPYVPNTEEVAVYSPIVPSVTQLQEEPANQIIPSFYVQNSTGNIAIGTNQVSSSSAKLTVAGDIKSGMYDPTSWGTSYSADPYRARIAIDNTASPSALVNYQEKITINTATLISAGKMRSDCGDMRFSDTDGATSLTYYIEGSSTNTCNTTSTIVFVKIPSIPASSKKNIYMYYGNPTASSASSTSIFISQITSSLKAAYKLDETSAATLPTDSSGNSNNATTVSGTTITNGKFFNARTFNGTSDYVEVPDSSSLQQATPMSLGVWFNTTSSATSCIVRKDSISGTRYLYSIGINSTTHKANAQYYNVTSNIIFNSINNVDDGTWHYAVMTIGDGGSNKLNFYVDGVSQGAAQTIAGTQGAPNGVMDIGACPPYISGARSGFYTGSTDEVRLYNTALTSTQVTSLYGNGGQQYGYTSTNNNGTESLANYSAVVPPAIVDTEQDTSQVNSTLYVNNAFGSVGIGTTNPTSMLDVEGTAQLRGAINGTGLSVNNLGNVAIGYTNANNPTPNVNLTINETLVSGNTTGINLQENGNGTYGGGMQITDTYNGNFWQIGNRGTLDASGIDSLNFVYYNGSAFSVDFALRPNGHLGINTTYDSGRSLTVGGSACTNVGNNICGDYAEFYNSSEIAGPGDVMELETASHSGRLVQKSRSSYNQKAIGIVATNPAVTIEEGQIAIGGYTNGQVVQPSMKPPIALAGRVPVKVSTINGPLHIGDTVTSSDIIGFAMKSTQPGIALGKVMQDFDPANSLTPDGTIDCPAGTPIGVICGKTFIFVNTSWNDPDVYLTSTGNFNIIPKSNGKYVLVDSTTTNPVTRIGAFAEAVIANIRAGSINVEKLTTKSFAITTDDITISGQSLRDYILSVMNSSGYGKTNGLLSPLAEVNQLRTNIISPLAQDSQIAITLTNSKIEVKKDASGSAVATIDNNGNASFAGTLNSNGLAVNNDATISGTLKAHNIVADNIDALAARVSSLSAQNITNVTNIYMATPSATPDNSSSKSGEYLAGNNNFGLLNGYTDVASFSAFLSYVPHMHATTAQFDEGLMSLGPTSLSDTTVNGQLAIGGTLILAKDSVNVLGGDLELQPLRQGGVSIASGAVRIDANGNLTVNGKAVFNDVLLAKVISPLPNQDLTIQLGDASATNSASQLKVQNASGSAVFAINQVGDFVASGAANINKLNFNLVAPALAVSGTETIATGSAGTTRINIHQKEITIDNPLVTGKSLIYITPVGDTNGQTPFLVRQIAGQSFTVGTSLFTAQDIRFNWLIVN